jgi:hypothetical protein
MTPNFINTHIPPPTFSDKAYQPNIHDTQIAFAFFSTYILFPMLYIIFSTGNIAPIMMLWRFIQSGILNTVRTIKEFFTDVVYSTLRILGHYTFSTYTVVKNGREIYSASSMCFFMHSDVDSVYRVDRAKYNVCKWIDRQCKQYRLDNDGEDPELTDTHNDIYDFIIHKVDNEAYARIHRGDFSGRTHTLITEHYRPFSKRNQMADKAELTICLPVCASDSENSEQEQEPEPKPETFSITLKHPYNFFLEKNEILDKKFLQWKLYNECGRKDVADYIGKPLSNYKLTLFYNESMKNYFSAANTRILAALKEMDAENRPKTETETETETEPDTEGRYPVYYLNDSHSILIGKRYVIKVDSVLRCPVFESSESQVYDIDSVLTNFYDCSDSDRDSDSDSDAVTDVESDSESESESESDSKSDSESDSKSDSESDSKNASDNTPLVGGDDPEFEMIEDPKSH